MNELIEEFLINWPLRAAENSHTNSGKNISPVHLSHTHSCVDSPVKAGVKGTGEKAL